MRFQGASLFRRRRLRLGEWRCFKPRVWGTGKALGREVHSCILLAIPGCSQCVTPRRTTGHLHPKLQKFVYNQIQNQGSEHQPLLEQLKDGCVSAQIFLVNTPCVAPMASQGPSSDVAFLLKATFWFRCHFLEQMLCFTSQMIKWLLWSLIQNKLKRRMQVQKHPVISSGSQWNNWAEGFVSLNVQKVISELGAVLCSPVLLA